MGKSWEREGRGGARGRREKGREMRDEERRLECTSNHIVSYVCINVCTRLKCLCACSLYNYVQYMHILTQIGAYERGVEVYMYST